MFDFIKSIACLFVGHNWEPFKAYSGAEVWQCSRCHTLLTRIINP